MLANKHEAELLTLEETQKEDKTAFIASWDKSMSSLTQQIEHQERVMCERHMQEYNEFKAQVEASVPKPKWSKSLLNARRIEEHLIRQQNFAKASKASKDLRSFWKFRNTD